MVCQVSEHACSSRDQPSQLPKILKRTHSTYRSACPAPEARNNCRQIDEHISLGVTVLHCPQVGGQAPLASPSWGEQPGCSQSPPPPPPIHTQRKTCSQRLSAGAGAGCRGGIGGVMPGSLMGRSVSHQNPFPKRSSIIHGH